MVKVSLQEDVLMNLKDFRSLLNDAFNGWLDAKAPRLGAALAFYAVVSLAPLLVFILWGVALVFGPDAAAGRLAGQIEGVVGQPMADALQEMIRDANRPWHGTWHTVLGVAMLLFGASGVFAELQDAMNTIWQVTPRPGRWLRTILRDRFLSFLMVMGVCILLLLSLVATAALAFLERTWGPTQLPGGARFWHVLNLGVSFVVVTVLFALILKILPDATVRWRDVWLGAMTTALLFTLGKYVLGVYLARGDVTSGYGAAGSLLVVLLWVYYASQILLFGAALTRAWAVCCGGGIHPTRNAVPLTTEDRVRQGIPTDAEVQAAARAAGEEERVGRS
jgi:membrane protein